MTKLTLSRLAEIEQAAEKATPGPWERTGVPGHGGGAHFAVGSPSGIVAVVHGSTATEVCSTRDMISQCDPATVAALCQIVRATVMYHDNPSPQTGKYLFEALSKAGL